MQKGQSGKVLKYRWRPARMADSGKNFNYNSGEFGADFL